MPVIEIISIEDSMIDQLAYQVITLSWNFFILRIAILPPAEVTQLKNCSPIMICSILKLPVLPQDMPLAFDAPKSTTKPQHVWRNMRIPSYNPKVSPRKQPDIATVTGGPKPAITLITRREMYFELAVFIMFDHAL